MASPLDAELYTLMDNSFQDLISNSAIITAKSIQIGKNGGDSCEKALEGDWEYIEEKAGVKRFKKTQPSNPNILIIGGIGVIDTPPKYVYRALTDLSRLKEWSSALEDSRIIREMENGVTELYLATRGKFPVAGRDFHLLVGKKTIKRDPLQKQGLFNRNYLVTVTSIQSDSNIPVGSGKVRGVLYPSGFMIVPHSVNGYKQPCSLVSYFAQIDLKGWIPTLITNLITNYSPLPMVKTFIPDDLLLSHDNPQVPYSHEGDKLLEEEEVESEEELEQKQLEVTIPSSQIIIPSGPSISPTKRQPIVEDDDDTRSNPIVSHPGSPRVRFQLPEHQQYHHHHHYEHHHQQHESDIESITSDSDEDYYYDPENDFESIITTNNNTTTTTIIHHNNNNNNSSPGHSIQQLQSIVGQMNHSIATLENTINKVRILINHEEQAKQRQLQLEESINRLTSRISSIEQRLSPTNNSSNNNSIISSPFSTISNWVNTIFVGINNQLKIIVNYITSDTGRRVTKNSTMLFILVFVWPLVSWKIYDGVKEFVLRRIKDGDIILGSDGTMKTSKPLMYLLFGSLVRKFT